MPRHVVLVKRVNLISAILSRFNGEIGHTCKFILHEIRTLTEKEPRRTPDLGYGSPARFKEKEEVQAVGRQLCQALFLGRVGE
jgi:hypothetical protein